jgi:hypothetical protein
MSILERLSSQTGERPEVANRAAAQECIDHPEMIVEIVSGLQSKQAALAGDSAEVLTMIAEDHPELVAASTRQLAPLLAHKTTRVRWEAAHALAYTAPLAPDVIQEFLTAIHSGIQKDASIIVRDYSIDAVGAFAQSSTVASEAAFPILIEALTLWDGRHAGHALNGLINVVRRDPSKSPEIDGYAQKFTNDPRGVIRKAAKKLTKECQKS